MNGKMIQCPGCGAMVPSGTERCIYCDHLILADTGAPVYLGYQAADHTEGQAAASPEVPGGDAFLFEEATQNDGLAVCGYIGADPTDVVIPAAHNGRPVTEIGWEAFRGLPVRSVTLPDTILRIGEAAFRDCGELFAVKGGGELLTVGEKAFAGCAALSRFSALDCLKVSIAYTSFAGCYQLGLLAERNCTLI